jgi:hypothetical protein
VATKIAAANGPVGSHRLAHGVVGDDGDLTVAGRGDEVMTDDPATLEEAEEPWAAVERSAVAAVVARPARAVFPAAAA